MMDARAHRKKPFLPSITKSIWLFPVICTIILILLSTFKISGSSIGVYNDILNGPGHKDSNLLFNNPRAIRSDEWVWNSQMIMAQASSHYSRINPNLGHGMDMSLIIDAPYKDWSAVFRPHNLVFFILPFQYAFAFKWWVMAYLLVISCYFFVLFLLPKKRLIATCISLALLFSPFIQWWYQYITLAPIYYSLFLLLAFMQLLKARSRLAQVILGLIIAYLGVCFILVLYPPFQIPCGLAALAFATGYLINQVRLRPSREILAKICLCFGGLILACLISLLFVHTRSAAVHSIQNTAYPGRRVISSGGYNFNHLFSGHLDFQLQFTKKASFYQLPKNGITNQSEDSNFLLLLPFLFLPSLYLLYRNYKSRKNLDWALILVNASFLVAVLWLFVPHLNLLSNLLLLSKVPQNRLIIGVGLLSFLQLVLFIKNYSDYKIYLLSKKVAAAYAFLIFIAELFLALHAKNSFPGYIGIYRCLAFSLPIPVIIYLLLTRHFRLAIAGLTAFTVLMTIGVNPLYRGTDIITNSRVSNEIKKISTKESGNWGVEDAYLENFAFLSGAHSLSGIYSYPQLDIWRQIKGADPDIYNRYAHTNFTFYRDGGKSPTKLELTGGDHFGVDTEPCGGFIKQNNIRFLLTDVPLSTRDKCLQIADKITYPARTIYIYRTY
jgi:hypothetical protein